MAQIAGKYDLESDEQRVAYSQEISELLATLPGAVEREIYAARAAETARITPDAMKLEVQRAFKRQAARERRAETRKDLNPAATLQPRERTLRYENIRSARAEEGVLRVVLLDPAYFSQVEDLKEEDFSSPLLGKVFSLLRRRWQEGRVVSLAALDGVLEPEELDHIAAVVQQPQARDTAGAALRDYISIIRREAAGAGQSPDDLLSIREKLKEKKSYEGA